VIKVVFCLRRRPDLTTEAFQRYWLEQHAPLVRAVAPLLRIKRYVQTHMTVEPQLQGTIDARGIATPPYDGVAELWWDSLEDVLAVGATKDERDAGRRLVADERNFIDLANSPMFYAREHDIHVQGKAAGRPGLNLP
jgi:uncharacterized protein (TIGR02118 family)